MAKQTYYNAEDGSPVLLSTARKISEYHQLPLPELFPDLLERELA